MPAVDSPVVVVTAIPEELEPILQHFERLDEERIGRMRVYRSAACRAPLVFAVTGDGSWSAEHNARKLCELLAPTALLGVGIAGALTPSLAALDLLAAARIRNGSGEMSPADSILLSLATGAGALTGTLVTVAAPVVTIAGKKSIARGLPSGERAAVDMESAAWARAAELCAVPFLAVRAISDTAREELPDYLAECVGPRGGIRRGAVIARALRRPSSIPALLHWKRRVSDCGDKLATFLWDYFDCERE
ncbi:MAG: phosphorylase family protein [Thermoanaerobaculia bacterium]